MRVDSREIRVVVCCHHRSVTEGIETVGSEVGLMEYVELSASDFPIGVRTVETFLQHVLSAEMFLASGRQ